MPQVSALDDYLHCPALVRWLPDRLAGFDVQHVLVPGAPAALRRFVRRWPAAEGTATSPDASVAVVIASSLRRPPPVELLESLPRGAVLIEVASFGGVRLGERLFGIPARKSTRRLTVRRLSAWLDVGLADIEQWLTTDPPDTCVTLGRRR